MFSPILQTIIRTKRRPLAKLRDIKYVVMQHANTVVTREMIARDVWRESTATWTNVIEVHIAQLRRKMERPDWPSLLHTVRGQGYVLGQMP